MATPNGATSHIVGLRGPRPDDTNAHSSFFPRALEKEVVLLCHRGCIVYRKRIAAAGQLCLRLLALSFVAMLCLCACMVRALTHAIGSLAASSIGRHMYPQVRTVK